MSSDDIGCAIGVALVWTLIAIFVIHLGLMIVSVWQGIIW